MADKTNPRELLDEALEAMRSLRYAAPSREHITSSATVACAEALSLLVDVHLPSTAPEPEPEPESDPREDLADDTPVGHGWVMVRNGRSLFKMHSNGSFMLWFRNARKWGSPGYWPESELDDFRPATVGDLRRVGVPVTEWPDITAPEPEAEQPLPEEPLVGSVVLDRDGVAWQQVYEGWESAPYALTLQWADLHRKHGPVTVIHRAKP